MSTVIAGPCRPERVGDAARRDARRRCRCRRSPRASGTRASARAVVVVHDARRTRRSGCPAATPADPRPLQRLPRRLEQQPLLRVDRQRLARADPEEPRRRTRPRRAGSRPRARTSCPARRGPGRTAPRRPSRDRPGTPRSRRRRSAAARHSPSGVSAPPGYRQPIATIAIGSSWRARAQCERARHASCGSRRTSSPCRRSSQRAAASDDRTASVAGRRSPVAAASRLRSSTAISESRPSSCSGRSGSTLPAEAPNTVAAVPRTSSSSSRSRSAADSPASRCLSPEPPRRAIHATGRAHQPAATAAAGSRQRAEQTAHSRRTGTSSGAAPRSAVSNSASPSSRRQRQQPAAAHARRVRSTQVLRHAAALRPVAPRQRRTPAALAHAGAAPAHRETRWPPRSWPARQRPARQPPTRTARTPQAPAPLVSSCRCQAASTLGANTLSMRSAPIASKTPSSSTPAVWMTAVSGCSAINPGKQLASAPRSRTSHAATAHARPRRRKLLPQRLRSRRAARAQQQMPYAMPRHQVPRHQPTQRPSAPRDQHRPSPDPARRASVQVGPRGRRPRRHQPRRESCVLAQRQLRLGSARRMPARADTGSRIDVEQRDRPGCSDCADRTSPHTGARARSVTSSPACAATAPRVTTITRLGAAARPPSSLAPPPAAGAWLDARPRSCPRRRRRRREAHGKTTAPAPRSAQRSHACSAPGVCAARRRRRHAFRASPIHAQSIAEDGDRGDDLASSIQSTAVRAHPAQRRRARAPARQPPAACAEPRTAPTARRPRPPRSKTRRLRRTARSTAPARRTRPDRLQRHPAPIERQLDARASGACSRPSKRVQRRIEQRRVQPKALASPAPPPGTPPRRTAAPALAESTPRRPWNTARRPARRRRAARTGHRAKSPPRPAGGHIRAARPPGRRSAAPQHPAGMAGSTPPVGAVRRHAHGPKRPPPARLRAPTKTCSWSAPPLRHDERGLKRQLVDPRPARPAAPPRAQARQTPCPARAPRQGPRDPRARDAWPATAAP